MIIKICSRKDCKPDWSCRNCDLVSCEHFLLEKDADRKEGICVDCKKLRK